MAEKITIARPYAKALFQLACENNAISQWRSVLAMGAFIVGDEKIYRYLKNPEVTTEQRVELFNAACGDIFDQQARYLIRVMATFRRLRLLTEVYVLFDQYVTEHEQTLEVSVTTAFPLDDDSRQQLMQVLNKKFKRKIILIGKTDAAILGGAIIRTKDSVIDGSVHGKLERLARTICNS